MLPLKTYIFLLSITFAFIACSQTKNDRIILGEEYAKEEIKKALTENREHNVVDNKKEIVKDSSAAIQIAESIVFSIYGKENIIKQRPYEIYKIDSYWLITGTLPKERIGGTFLIIIDSRDSRIIRLTHGK